MALAFAAPAWVFFPAVAGDANLPTPESETAAQRGYRWLTTKPYIPVAHDQEVFDDLWKVWEEPAPRRRPRPRSKSAAKWPFRGTG